MLNEYIDFEKIIQRLQDLDKLKTILLTDSQRFFFDQIPKPTILGDSAEKTIFGENQILKNKMTKQRIKENFERFGFDACNSKIDKKILSMLDQKTLSKLNLNPKTSSNLQSISKKYSTHFFLGCSPANSKVFTTKRAFIET